MLSSLDAISKGIDEMIIENHPLIYYNRPVTRRSLPMRKNGLLAINLKIREVLPNG